jgi:hypothetical protein
MGIDLLFTEIYCGNTLSSTFEQSEKAASGAGQSSFGGVRRAPTGN